MDIELNETIVQNMKSLNELIMFISSTSERIRILDKNGLDETLTLKDLKKRKPKVLLWIQGFINTTPSDYFTITNKEWL